jgi:hypothetical protein
MARFFTCMTIITCIVMHCRYNREKIKIPILAIYIP